MLIIPAIDIRGGKCVRLFQGDYNRETVYGDSPAEQGIRWEKEGAHIIHLVDLDGAKAKRPVNLDAVREICSAVHIPCELGGGIRTLEDARKAFDAGIYRIILGTVACENPKLAKEFVSEFTAERVVVGIDARGGCVAVNGWLENSGVDAYELVLILFYFWVTSLIYTDIATDGALSGPNCDAIAALCSRVPRCGVISSGGISSARDITALRELRKDNLEGVIVGKALYDGKISYKELEGAAND